MRRLVGGDFLSTDRYLYGDCERSLLNGDLDAIFVSFALLPKSLVRLLFRIAVVFAALAVVEKVEHGIIEVCGGIFNSVSELDQS